MLVRATAKSIMYYYAKREKKNPKLEESLLVPLPSLSLLPPCVKLSEVALAAGRRTGKAGREDKKGYKRKNMTMEEVVGGAKDAITASIMK